jgi:hypothetical protein
VKQPDSFKVLSLEMLLQLLLLATALSKLLTTLGIVLPKTTSQSAGT